MGQGYDYDFIGFTFNGKHSCRDLKIYRTSNGGRYDTNLTPTFNDKTANVAGQVGQYYFGTEITNRTFSISFAFDELTEAELNELKNTFRGDSIHELIFDEEPYKVYSAKVTGMATIKHLCFEHNEHRVYKGEGTIQFTCYYPYARSRKTVPMPSETVPVSVTFTKEYIDEEKTQFKYIPNPSRLSITCGVVVTDEFNVSLPVMASNSGIGYVRQLEIHYFLPNGVFRKKTIDVNQNGDFITVDLDPMAFISQIIYIFKDLAIADQGTSWMETFNPCITNSGYYYFYTTKKCYEPWGAGGGNGLIVNHYNITDFPSKFQWAPYCGLGIHTLTNSNTGDLPCPFTFKFAVEGTGEHKIQMPDNEAVSFTVTNTDKDLVWDTKTGLIIQDGKIIPATGGVCYELPVGKTFSVLDGSNVDSLGFEYNLIYR